MSALLEFECEVPVGGYDVITVENPDRLEVDPPIIRILQPRSERTRRFDLFKARSAFLEFAQTPAIEDGIKAFADRYGPLVPDRPENFRFCWYGRHIDKWFRPIRSMHQLVELWNISGRTGDFSKIIRAVQRQSNVGNHGWPVELFLKEDPQSASARLCIRPSSLREALWTQLILAIDGNVNLNACVQCRKWFTLEAGRGRSDKEYCSNACRMRAYRKRKGTE
jgi:hypothetical protein